MINEYTLKMLCEKYKVSSDKLVNKNNIILDKGKYLEIDSTLDYLINGSNIKPINIEKCPSVLYFNINVIKDNVKFLKSTELPFSYIENCLHILSTDPEELKKVYKYILEYHGLNALKKNTSVLACSLSTIEDIEKLNINKDGILQIATVINLGYTSLAEVQRMINSEEYKSHPELFTSTTLAHARIEEIKSLITSEEYKSHPELFTSETLAFSNIECIKSIITSEEYKSHPELFTSTTLAYATIEDIRSMINSEEYEAHPELFTSTTLAFAKIEDISELLSMPYWEDIRYKELLTSSVVAKAKSMIKKLPKLISLAEYYKIDNYLNTSFLLFSPSQNYALINYLLENGFQLVIDDKLNPIFGKQPGFLKKKYGIDIKELMKKYSYEEVVEQNVIR